MTEQEWYSLIDKTLNAETGAAAVVELKDAVTVELANSQTLQNTLNTLTEENTRLRDTNAQLALRVTSTVTPKEEPKEEPQDALEDLLKSIKGE